MVCVRKLIEGPSILICEGDIKVIRPNVIVHPTNSHFEIHGDLGKEIRNVNGDAFHETMEKLRGEKRSLAPGEAAIENGMNLGTTKVIHANVLNSLRNKKEKCLPKTVQNVLKLAEQENFKGVVFPEMGCGKIPAEQAAKAVVDTLVDYFSSVSKQSCITAITLLFSDFGNTNDFENMQVYREYLKNLEGGQLEKFEDCIASSE